jgi:hypothetical protein
MATSRLRSASRGSARRCCARSRRATWLQRDVDEQRVNRVSVPPQLPVVTCASVAQVRRTSSSAKRCTDTPGAARGRATPCESVVLYARRARWSTVISAAARMQMRQRRSRSGRQRTASDANTVHIARQAPARRGSGSGRAAHACGRCNAAHAAVAPRLGASPAPRRTSKAAGSAAPRVRRSGIVHQGSSTRTGAMNRQAMGTANSTKVPQRRRASPGLLLATREAAGASVSRTAVERRVAHVASLASWRCSQRGCAGAYQRFTACWQLEHARGRARWTA